jgi:hypothetical protein
MAPNTRGRRQKDGVEQLIELLLIPLHLFFALIGFILNTAWNISASLYEN